MASSHSQTSGLLFFFFVVLLQMVFVSCTQYEVGGQDGWVVPKPKDDQVYNEWASKQRFKIGDTLHFVYKKDSVLLVTEEEFDKCKSPHPMFFSNNGDTVFKFDRSGFFYFISGVTGHCEKGEKMIIKVLEPAQAQAQAPLSQDSTHKKKSASSGIAATTKTALILLIASSSTLFLV